jgi:DNA-binding response OmpR family regulator
VSLLQKKQILIVDDEPSWLRILTYFLKDKGYDVRAAQSGMEALATLGSFTPDLILSDVRMPDMNGFDLLDSIKKLPNTTATPVVFFSAIDDFDARKTARDLGATDYIVKPFDEKDVGLVISKYLRD